MYLLFRFINYNLFDPQLSCLYEIMVQTVKQVKISPDHDIVRYFLYTTGDFCTWANQNSERGLKTHKLEIFDDDLNCTVLCTTCTTTCHKKCMNLKPFRVLCSFIFSRFFRAAYRSLSLAELFRCTLFYNSQDVQGWVNPWHASRTVFANELTFVRKPGLCMAYATTTVQCSIV